jgi:Na+/proline symporter
MTFLTTRPLWVLITLMLVLTALGMTGPVLVRRRIALEKLRTNNEVAGFKFATIGVLYAVTLAFVVIITWERFHDAERALAAEAGAAATIYRLSTGLDEPAGAALRRQITAYLQSVVDDEWPAMAAGHWSHLTTGTLNSVYGTLVRYRPADLHDADVQEDLLREIDKLTEARRERLMMAQGTVPNAIWLVVLLGAGLTIAFTFFFGTQNVLAQSLMTGVLAALIFSAILVVIAIDRPFTGAVVVPQESIRTVLQEFQAHP